MRSSEQSKGFTLIELLIVVAIIAILALIAVPNFLEAQTRAKVSRSKSDQRSVAMAYMAFLIDKPSSMLVDFWDDDKGDAFLRQRLWEELGCVTQWNNRRGGVAGILVPLTTPIAYMTGFPNDPFATDDNVSSFIGGNPPLIPQDRVKPHTYMYMDDESLFEPNDRDHGSDLMDKNNRNGWLQYAVKPILVDQWVLIGLGPGRSGGYTGIGQLYDPTNGTVSDGYIIRYSDQSAGN